MPLPQPAPNSSLYLRNVPDTTTNKDLVTAFAKYGLVKDVYIPVNRHTGQPRGFAYVEYESVQDAEDAMHNVGERGIMINGQNVGVSYAFGSRKTPDEMQAINDNMRYGTTVPVSAPVLVKRSPTPYLRSSRSRSPPKKSPSPSVSRDTVNRHDDKRQRRRYSRDRSRSVSSGYSRNRDNYRDRDYNHRDRDNYRNRDNSRNRDNKYRRDDGGGYYRGRHVTSRSPSYDDNNKDYYLDDPRRSGDGPMHSRWSQSPSYHDTAANTTTSRYNKDRLDDYGTDRDRDRYYRSDDRLPRPVAPPRNNNCNERDWDTYEYDYSSSRSNRRR